MEYAPIEEDDRDFVRALARGLAVLEAFTGTEAALSLSEVAARVGLSRGSARRLLLTLDSLGFVGTTETGRFHLRPSVLRLGYSFLSSQPVWRLSRDILQGLSEATNEACSIAVLDNHDVVYVARVAPRQIMQDQVSIGTRLPAYCSSLGRALLTSFPPSELQAYLASAPRVKHTPLTETDVDKLLSLIRMAAQDGYAISDQEIQLGLCSIAVPIYDSRGQVAAAMNVSTKSRRTEPDRRRHLAQLRDYAGKMSALLTARQL